STIGRRSRTRRCRAGWRSPRAREPSPLRSRRGAGPRCSSAELDYPVRRKLILGHEAACPAPMKLCSEVALIAGRREHDRRAAATVREPLRDLEPIDVRELDVEQDDLRLELARGGHCRLAVFGLADDLEALVLEQRPGDR